MSAKIWVEVKGRRRIVLFLLAVVAFIAFWLSLPDEVRNAFATRRIRRAGSLPLLMLAGWIGGWFTFLFVRAEDRELSAPVDYQGLCRVVSILMIASALVIAGILVVGLYLSKGP